MFTNNILKYSLYQLGWYKYQAYRPIWTIFKHQCSFDTYLSSSTKAVLSEETHTTVPSILMGESSPAGLLSRN